MAITYTTSWQSSATESEGNNTKTRMLAVVAEGGEVLNPTNVFLATDKTTGAAMPVRNDPYPFEPGYFLQSRSSPRLVGPRYAEVVLTYGRGSGNNTDDPNNATRYRVRNGISSETTDADVNGNAMLNSAGVPFSGTVQTNVSAIFIDAIRVEPAYNLPQAVAFTNKINGDAFQLAGYPINPGEAYCLGIQPDADYTLEDATVVIVYSFEIRDRLTLGDGSRATAFIHRLLDQGQEAWTYNDQLVQMFHANGDGGEVSAVTSDVLLDNGIPLDPASYTNPDINFDQADGRGWANTVNRAPNAVRDQIAPGSPTFLLYQKHYTENFSGLSLG